MRSRHFVLFGLALLYTLFNAPKPLLIDDAAYYYYAKQIAHDPLRPYDFAMFWYQWPHPAMKVLAPPGLPTWWAIAYRLFGEQPFLWKLWLLPFSVLFVFALHALFRRFARGVEMPLVVLTVFSPTFLPSLNLMLDVPALALCLTAITLFFRAAARSSFTLALLAGLLAGLGMETKYTGFLAPCVIFLYAVLFRRLVLGITAAAVAGLFFAGWEALIYRYHGQSHFLANLGDQGDLEERLGYLLESLFMLIGAVSPALTLLGLTALGVRAWKVALVGVVLAGGYVVVALYKGTFWLETGSGIPAAFAMNTAYSLESVIFGGYGLFSFAVAGSVLWQLLVRDEPEEVDVMLVDAAKEEGFAYPWWLSPFLRIDLFLLCWLLGETTAYFFLTPFPAVRRIMGILVVATLVVGRLASRTCNAPSRRWLLHGVTVAGVALGFLFYGVDMLDAFTSKHLAESAAAVVRQHDPNARIWYVGHWGFQFYAEQAGMKPVVPTAPTGWSSKPPSELQAGDWLVVPEPRLNQQPIRVEPDCTEPVEEIVVETRVPLRTVQCFYGGQAPLEHHEGPRGRVTVYRVTAAFVARWRAD